jgi:AraC family transcriptional regulator
MIGSADTLRPAIQSLYADWLPRSGEDLRDVPLLAERIRFFPDVPENEAITDIYLPLR